VNHLIRNALIVNEGARMEGDLRIRDGLIDEIGSGLAATQGEIVHEAEGRWLLPGMIDDQVHFREPGLEHKGDIASESRAAVAGGITSYMEMPNTRPPVLSIEALDDKYRRAQGRSFANYAFYMGASNDNLAELLKLQPGQSSGIKVFMGASTGNMLVDDPDTLDAIFAQAPARIITHCEDSPTIDALLAAMRASHPEGLRPEHHPLIRSREACIKSTRLAIELARRHGTRLHVLHISTADELTLFDPGPLQDKRITAETCVHFLHFDEGDYRERGNFIKCNPAIKSASDRKAIVKALADGRLDILATDHAPHTLAEKELPYESAPAGLTLVQHVLPCAMERVFDGELALERLVEVTSHAPATLFGVRGRGFIREGYAADLVLIDPRTPLTVRREDVLSRAGWAPFEGQTFRSSVAATWVNGHLAWDGSEVHAQPAGQRLELSE
jgi:dihydroorotase